MSRVVLSIGSNIGDRLAMLQAAVDGLGDTVRALSPVYETDAWGGVEQTAFLNAVVIAEDSRLDAWGWLRRAQALEEQNNRVRDLRWGPRTLDVDLLCCHDIAPDGEHEVLSDNPELTLPHPLAHQRAFVLIPWLAVDPDATLTVAGQPRRLSALIAGLKAAERDGVRRTEMTLRRPPTEGGR